MKTYYDRKVSRTNLMVAHSALAHNTNARSRM
jgi:hypothetical protein